MNFIELILYIESDKTLWLKGNKKIKVNGLKKLTLQKTRKTNTMVIHTNFWPTALDVNNNVAERELVKLTLEVMITMRCKV